MKDKKVIKVYQERNRRERTIRKRKKENSSGSLSPYLVTYFNTFSNGLSL